MRRHLFPIIFVATFFCCHKKNTAQTNVYAGFEVTPHLSWMYNRDDVKSNNFSYFTTPGSSLGISTVVSFNKRIGMAINVLYSRQGQWYQTNDQGRCRELQYYKVPIMFIYKIPLNEELSLIGKFGPQLGILKQAMLYDRSGNVIDFNQSKGYNNLDFGTATYIGIHIFAEKLVVDISLRADASLLGIENTNYKKEINEPMFRSLKTPQERKPTYNITLGLTLGILYIL